MKPNNDVERSSAAGAQSPGGPGRVTIISHNLALGGSLACLSLARALRKHFSVQIMGSLFGREPWPGVHDDDVDVETFAGARLPGYFRTLFAIAGRVRGDVIIAHQFRLPSFGVGLLCKLRYGIPCAVYIDDDDIALTMAGRSNPWHRRLRAPGGDLFTRAMCGLRRRADATFCGSEYFAGRLGGITVPLGRNAEFYDPDLVDREHIRHSLDIGPEQMLVGFMGNPRPHVGIEDLVAALELVPNTKPVLLVAPPGKVSDGIDTLFRESTVDVRVLSGQPSKAVPGLLAASDLVVVPQRTEHVSLGQLPARLVEAMARAKPIITTKLGDIPQILGDAGVYVPERSPSEIAAAIRSLHADPERAKHMGREARAAFLGKLSLDAMAERLVPEIEGLIARRRGV